jgi:hypothetical protein
MAVHWYQRYSREEFAALDGSEQSRIIALYMIQQHVDSIVSAEHIKEMRRNQTS